MRKLLLATAALVMLAFAAPAHACVDICTPGATCNMCPGPGPNPPPPEPRRPDPPPQPQEPLVETFWIYNWVQCYNDVGDCVVNITVDGLNVHRNGYDYAMDSSIQFAVPNGTPVHVFERNGRWLHVTFACQLAPTGLWSDTAGVPFMACQ